VINKKPELVVGDMVIVYIRPKYPPTKSEVPVVRSVVVKSVGLTNSVWTYNFDTEDSFRYSEVEYVLRKGKWKSA
jgi:hypothetical protein